MNSDTDQNARRACSRRASGTAVSVLDTRPRRFRRRRRPPIGAYGLLGIALVLAAAGGGLHTGRDAAPPSTAVRQPPGVSSSAAALVRDPTPLLARSGELYLRMPVEPGAVTQVAFHQASGDKAAHLEALVPDASVEEAAALRAVVPPKTSAAAADPEEAATVWTGTVIRLWRSNRRGAPDTAIDCGAEAGSDVFAPLSGTVTSVRAYKLYGRYDDFEIHIRPDGHDDLDLVLIHIDDVAVQPGDRVEGGVTRIACVRKMSDKTELQLAPYTPNGGDHVHVQLNRVDPSGPPSGLDEGS